MTGASGFLGRHVLQALGSRGIPAIALVRDVGAWERMSWTRDLVDVTPLVGTVTETGRWESSPRLDGLRGVLHLGALVKHSRTGSDEVYRTNVDGTVNLTRIAADRGCRIVFASTSGTVGCFPAPGSAADEDAPFCTAEVAGWPYYHSKVLAEQAARSLANDRGADLVIVRPPVLLGPGDHRFRSTGHLIRFLSGRLPFLVRGGIHYADVRDGCVALVHALEIPSPRPIYHLVGTICPIQEFFALAGDVVGRAPPRLLVPPWIAWWLATLLKPFHLLPDPVVVELASHWWGTTSRYAEADLGYRSRPARDTIADTIDWLLANHPDLARRPVDRRSSP
ncbi:MAG TPA: NAD-dependent epimerase/dehydratase family protein [Gemmatimonadaceae bacterium]